MRKLTYTTQSNRYYIGETTSGATNDIFITDGKCILKLEDCLIWDSETFTLDEFDDIVSKLIETELTGQTFFDLEGWSLEDVA
ncbi:hypothetical protein UFOVP181_451 [uncultured Caudovirales phage]|uniref:Uncharacterized protein n=1 Tax=uncultured Caudovirales phage TaxID=2100421 RepID=A0A6J5KWT9_9CAUD|nr:hypothetical protein UFOVP57_190 [uncultured Caudovirales phage]CAB5209364.1 hypothetical protein UFOVP181_451 [uncultured Caudovirales phage]